MATSPPPYTKSDGGPGSGGPGYGFDGPGYGYPPPPQTGYGQPGNPPLPQAGYPAQPYPYPQPPPMMAPAPQMQTSNNVVVVNQPAAGNTVIIQEKGINHCLHCCISIFFPPWIIVWICLCICG